jgi:hypothetical protein
MPPCRARARIVRDRADAGRAFHSSTTRCWRRNRRSDGWRGQAQARRWTLRGRSVRCGASASDAGPAGVSKGSRRSTGSGRGSDGFVRRGSVQKEHRPGCARKPSSDSACRGQGNDSAEGWVPPLIGVLLGELAAKRSERARRQRFVGRGAEEGPWERGIEARHDHGTSSAPASYRSRPPLLAAVAIKPKRFAHEPDRDGPTDGRETSKTAGAERADSGALNMNGRISLYFVGCVR